jgi:RNA polymerase sigma-70 factor (ECF subfamily)
MQSTPRSTKASTRRGSAVETADDAELIQRTGQGDGEAFTELYRRFGRPVLSLATRRLRDRGRAEDATQDTFTAIWRFAATYPPERGPGAPWLFTVARNAVVNQTRARPEPGGAVPDTASAEPGPPEQAESDWNSRRVHAALEQLPGHLRALVELAYWGDLSQAQIAIRLGIPLGTVKTRTRRALFLLAELLDGGAEVR